MATLVTTSGKTVLLDSEDYDILVKNFNSPPKISVTTNGSVILNIDANKKVILARLLLGIEGSRNLIVKYLNNNKLDLRRRNLEKVKRTPPPASSRPRASRVKGVHKLDYKTWIVEDGYDKVGKPMYKKFNSFEEAKGFVSKTLL